MKKKDNDSKKDKKTASQPVRETSGEGQSGKKSFLRKIFSLKFMIIFFLLILIIGGAAFAGWFFFFKKSAAELGVTLDEYNDMLTQIHGATVLSMDTFLKTQNNQTSSTTRFVEGLLERVFKLCSPRISLSVRQAGSLFKDKA
ncbi:MAG: hypothetical protein HQK67_09760, partial [Desulfamplus sp.]|nr:hypothetical protein [Desulfamplus sp.]